MNACRIIEATARSFWITVEDIQSRSRKEPVATARQVAMSLVRSQMGWTVIEVGKKFDRHHADVIHATRRIKERRVNEKWLDDKVKQLEEKFVLPKADTKLHLVSRYNPNAHLIAKNKIAA